MAEPALARESPAPSLASGGRFPLLRVLRPHQWVKNLLLFVPVMLDHKLLDTPVMRHAVVAFVAFCCAASGGYVLNDLVDREADRRHARKRHRPFASGALSPVWALALAPTLFVVAIWMSWTTLSLGFVELLALYMLLTASYSYVFKRIAVVDVLLLAGLYTLRVVAGVEAAQVRFSAWLLAFSMFLFLSLAFLKRYTEISALTGGADEQARGRGYIAGDREWLSSMGSASGYMSVLVLALYINSDQVVTLYRTPLVLWLICPLLLYWIGRMWLQAFRGRVHDDPLVAAVFDRSSYVVALLVGLLLWAAL